MPIFALGIEAIFFFLARKGVQVETRFETHINIEFTTKYIPMKFFIDTANLDQIQEAQALGILDGVTTNPSLMAKEGITGQVNIINHYKAICE